MQILLPTIYRPEIVRRLKNAALKTFDENIIRWKTKKKNQIDQKITKI